MISKFDVRLKSLLDKEVSELELYADLVYKFKNIVGTYNFQRSSVK